MSFNQPDMINLSNYEEYFILYMDNELGAEQKLMVENFIARHPHLAQELDVLMNTKLPLDCICFDDKEELFSPSMKVNAVDESLLLYIDNELPSVERKVIEEKISSSDDLALQHSLLMKTKLDASEKISYPNKKELYRYPERVIVFKAWMRIAAAIILLCVGSLFFLLNKNDKPGDLTANTIPGSKNTGANKKETLLQQTAPVTDPSRETNIVAKTSVDEPRTKVIAKHGSQKVEEVNDIVLPEENMAVKEREVIHFDANRFTIEPTIPVVAVNKTITHIPVTSLASNRIIDEGAQEPADTGGDFKNTKKTSAKGFFRKVTRFIEHNTGIGTANADDEVLIGAVALKLK